MMSRCGGGGGPPGLHARPASAPACVGAALAWPVCYTRPHPAHPLPAHCSPTPLAQFCLRLTREAGVTLIPVSAFYADRAAAPRTLVRFVYCKTDEKLNTACNKLAAYFGGQ